jgi:hypothetical protein
MVKAVETGSLTWELGRFWGLELISAPSLLDFSPQWDCARRRWFLEMR